MQFSNKKNTSVTHMHIYAPPQWLDQWSWNRSAIQSLDCVDFWARARFYNLCLSFIKHSHCECFDHDVCSAPIDLYALWVSAQCTCLWNCGLCPSLESVTVQLCILSILIVIWDFLHVFVVVINCICHVVTCIVQLCVVFILILIGGQRDKGVSPTTYFISLGCMWCNQHTPL